MRVPVKREAARALITRQAPKAGTDLHAKEGTKLDNARTGLGHVELGEIWHKYHFVSFSQVVLLYDPLYFMPVSASECPLKKDILALIFTSYSLHRSY